MRYKRNVISRKAQLSFEFMILMAAAVLIFSTFAVIAANQMSLVARDKRSVGALDIAQTVQLELLTANHVSNGYVRTFTLPPTANNFAYSVSLSADGNLSTITVASGSIRVVLDTPYCNGNFSVGVNTIRKTNDTLWCDS